MSTDLLDGINIPSSISKEECIYCFETPFNNIDKGTHAITSDHNLNICLSCFQPVCKIHRELHMNVTSNSCDFIHTGYLNIMKNEKRSKIEGNDQSGSGNNNNKKIKLQVIEKSEDELYETFWKLIKCDTESGTENIILDSETTSNDQVPKEIKEILNAKSQVLADQAKSWELEIKSCTHSQNFDLSKVPETKVDTSKCSDCELSSNLWLCLFCGNIGCGREQVGIEGHSHGLKHYETHQDHCLAIKLGSLSKDSNDLFCYQDDDEVRFDYGNTLAMILQRFSIDINNKSATEKTLTELQVEQNMNWDFKMTDSEGNELIKLNPNEELGCGLINLGNSCYMNSILQCLFNGGVANWSQDITELIGCEFPTDIVYPANNMLCQLIKLNNAINITPEYYTSGIKPRSFKKCIAGSNEEFCSNRQQDSMEFLTFLIEQLDTKYFNKNKTECNPNDLFRFSMEDKLQCQRCNKVKYSYDNCDSIQLPLKENDEPQELLERLDYFFNGEIIEFRCPSCKEMSTAMKKSSIKSYPDTLVVNPVRIKLVNWTPVKTSNELILPGVENAEEYLDISKYQSRGFDASTEVLLEESDESEFKPSQTVMSQLKEMGFTDNAILRALYDTGNSENAETPLNWLFQHMEDVDINSEFQVPKKQAVDEDKLNNMMAMGLPANLCKKALILNKGDVNISVEWVFNNMDDDGEIEVEEENKSASTEYGHSDSTPYKLTGVVCHKGNSVHSGHYVAFIRKEIDGIEKWVLYNDEKIVIVESTEEIKKNGYIYSYSRV